MAVSQPIKFAGTHPADTAVLNLISNYQNASKNWKTVAQRLAKLRPFLSPGYFYYGMYGAPVGIDSLIRVQPDIKFSRISDSTYSFTLFQYQNSAVLKFKIFEKGMVKGKLSQGTGNCLVMMSKEYDKWKIIAEIMGEDL